jgi:hypothetical protein
MGNPTSLGINGRRDLIRARYSRRLKSSVLSSKAKVAYYAWSMPTVNPGMSALSAKAGGAGQPESLAARNLADPEIAQLARPLLN